MTFGRFIGDKWQGLCWRFSTKLARPLFSGVAHIGSRCRVMGQPIFSIEPGGSLCLGKRVSILSSSASNALGVARPTILRCLTASAALIIGDDCGLSGAAICAAYRVEIGSRCLFGADVMVSDTDFHSSAAEGRGYAAPAWSHISKSVRIGDDVFTGARSTIGKGVTIGNGAIIGFGSVAVHDVAPYTIVAGNPARQVGEVAQK